MNFYLSSSMANGSIVFLFSGVFFLFWFAEEESLSLFFFYPKVISSSNALVFFSFITTVCVKLLVFKRC